MSETGATAARKIVLDVGGMHCGNCSGKVQKALNDLPGVTYALVSHERGEARVRFSPSEVTPDALVAAVEAAGFTASVQP